MSRDVFVVFDSARTLAPELAAVLRPDMAAQFAAEGARLPPGPKWTLRIGGRFVAIGGLEPSGAAASRGWLLTGELTAREWAAVRGLTRTALEWAACHAIRRVRVLADGRRAGAAPMLERLGFHATGEEDGHIIMTAELTR